MDPGLDARDQVKLPDPPLKLPNTQRQKSDDPQQRDRCQEPPFGSTQEPMPGSVIGIMLVLRWNMIHSEPAITISTITAAKA